MSKERFFEMVSNYPRIAKLWNKEREELLIENLESALGVMSSGESDMTRFFVSIWFWNNKRYGFDLIDAVSRVDIQDRTVILTWVGNPFWP